MLAQKEAIAKRATTLARKWKRRVRYYERKLARAASAAPPKETASLPADWAKTFAQDPQDVT